MDKKYKNVSAVIPPPPYHMVGDGFRVHNFFPSSPEIGNTGMSPFFLLDYGAKWNVPPSGTPKGVGVHPHRGIETVTIAFKGSVAHHDSAGNSGIINEGDVQWMTAGGGVLHKEYHEKEFSRKGGIMHMAQLWVNLPSRYKMTPAKYQEISRDIIGRHILDDGSSSIEIIAGRYKDIDGPATTFSPLSLLTARLHSHSSAPFIFDKTHNTGMLVAEGSIKVNNSVNVGENNFILFGHDGEYISVEALEESTVLILDGEPIDEPIAPYGPFVMNTSEEIRAAYEDYYSGKFGYLED